MFDNVCESFLINPFVIDKKEKKIISSNIDSHNQGFIRFYLSSYNLYQSTNAGDLTSRSVLGLMVCSLKIMLFMWGDPKLGFYDEFESLLYNFSRISCCSKLFKWSFSN